MSEEEEAKRLIVNLHQELCDAKEEVSAVNSDIDHFLEHDDTNGDEPSKR